ncbi:sensor histidine kinase [Thermoflavimicrobium dichotomicum]|uniref:histidine kinase n=1 Tax=Thermoflavimicrobium dichotomicum TaxID=46223 RepID=A0A1I3K960_9BACL|nr:ATP-binding protein [Thermoflavimicrobium dichotomicum]SFI69032.1 diguanylate cyclase (GGDEF) domain-containing protein [Thermoflavimicrobium dichotomicum]
MLDDFKAFETRMMYDLVKNFFSNHPFLYWTMLSAATIALLVLIFLNQSKVNRFPPYGYMLSVLVALVAIDILTLMIPMMVLYLIVLGNVLVRTNRERIVFVTCIYAATFHLLQLGTYVHSFYLARIISETFLFVWISWISLQVRRSFIELKKTKKKNVYLLNKLREAQQSLHEYHAEIEETYRRDYLTGLYNLGGFQEQMIRTLSRCSQNQSYHVICIDLTDFKQVNMKHGMEYGDELLVMLARQLKKNLPPHVQLARYDGDQFAIGLMGDQKALCHGLNLIDQVMKGLKEEQGLPNYCLGTASYPKEANSAAELIRLAEERLSIEQQRLRDKEDECRRHLEKLSAVGQLAAGLAHEIRNPLTSIRGFVQISAAESDAVKKWESIILPEIDRINDLLKQFLKLSESRPAKFAYFDLDQLIRDVFSLLQPRAFLMGHELKLYPPISRVMIEADPEQLKQVLINLVQNGLESLTEKGRVEIHWREMRDRVIIRVKDTGVGIRPEHYERIFEPFFTTKGEGTGMGLSICQRIISDHGGHIHVTSPPGRGTVFHIHLPIRQSKENKTKSFPVKKMMEPSFKRLMTK